MDVNELLRLIKKGESEEVEFKECFTKGIGRTIVAFANTRGGIILIGVDKTGNIVGASDEDLERIDSLLQNIHPKPRITIDKIEIGKKKIIVIRVEPGDRIYSYNNVVYVRIGSANIPLSVEEIAEKMGEQLLLRFDELPSEATVEDLSEELLDRFIRKTKEVRKRDLSKVPRETLFRILKITKNGNLTNAALLFFTEDPQLYYPYAKVRIMVFGENRDVVKEDIFIGGSVWDQAIKALDEVLERLPKGFEVMGVERIEDYPIDVRVLREGIVNAIVHRNYFIPSETIIEVYPSKIRIINPGGFPPGVTPENPIHKPRNPILAEYFFNVGLIEKYGIGIEMMRKICRERGFPEPVYERITDFSILTLTFCPIYLRKHQLRDIDKVVYAIVMGGPKSASEIAEEIGKSKSTVLRSLKRLMKLGLVEQIGSGKATKYVAK